MKFICKKSLFILALLFVFSFNSVFGEAWFVCLGSFKIKQNADNRVAELGKYNIPCFVYETQTDGQILYRVLFDEQYDDRNVARAARNKLNNNTVINRLGINGLWICMAEREEMPVVPEPEPVPEPVPEPALTSPASSEVVLQENKTDSIPLSEEKPYSVLVRSYKEEYAAENTKDRLVEDEIDAYILGKYDDKTLFSFDVHAGAFETEEETEDLIDELEEKGIEDVELSDYNEIADSIEKFDEMVKTQTVVYDSGEETIPTIIPVAVQKCINEFPLNKVFQIEELTIIDLDNTNYETVSTKIQETVSLFTTDISTANAISVTVYKDELFGKSVGVLIAQNDEGSFSFDDIEKEAEFLCDYQIRGGVLKSKLYTLPNGIYLFGTTEDGTIRIEMGAENFTLEEFNTFMSDSYADSNMLIYPQLRKNLFILPDNSETPRKFQMFTLEKIGKDYVERKQYQDWAWGIYGHWCAIAWFEQEEEVIRVYFYDLDYDYNANQNQKMFMDSHPEDSQNEYNHKEAVHDTEGWYVRNQDGGELSFANKSYVVSVDIELDSTLDLTDLHTMADDLKIW